LGGVGRRTRLSVLTARKRTAQQDRLWQALFLAARDGSTLPLAHQLIAAHTDAVTNPRALLEGFVAGRWGALPDDVQRKVELALAFGHLARALLERFNRAYAHVDTHGWVADIDDVARAAFPVDEAAQLRITGQAVLQAAEHGRFGKLQFHGPQFLTLLRKLADAPPTEALEHLLAYHRSVQRSRRGGGAWLRSEQRKLVMQVAGYNGYKSEPSFPSLKLDAVRQLLADLGRIA
jgi:hypothetical protein